MKRLHFLSMTTTIKTFKNTANYFGGSFQPGGDFVSLKKSLLMLKEATKCRQYEPQENIAMMGYLLKSHSKALSSIMKS